jgi:hypothetical protein
MDAAVCRTALLIWVIKGYDSSGKLQAASERQGVYLQLEA